MDERGVTRSGSPPPRPPGTPATPTTSSTPPRRSWASGRSCSAARRRATRLRRGHRRPRPRRRPVPRRRHRRRLHRVHGRDRARRGGALVRRRVRAPHREAPRQRPAGARGALNAIAEATSWFDDLAARGAGGRRGPHRRRAGGHHLDGRRRGDRAGGVGPRRIHHFRLTRAAIEDVFRTLATEPLADRVHNPGLEAARADVIVGGCCALVALVRRLGIDELLVSESDILDGLVASLEPKVPAVRPAALAAAGRRVGHDPGRAVRHRARRDRPRRRCAPRRSTTRPGSGTPSSTTSASRSRRPTSTCSTPPPASRGRRGSPADAPTWPTPAATAGRRDPRRRRRRLGGRGGRHPHVDLRRAARPGRRPRRLLAQRGVGRGRRRRHLPADAPRDDRRRARGGQAGCRLRARLLRLRRRGGAGAPRGRRRPSPSSPPTPSRAGASRCRCSPPRSRPPSPTRRRSSSSTASAASVALDERVAAWPPPATARSRPRPSTASTPLFLAYTSGTTGRPKGVVHVHGGWTVKVAEEGAFQTDIGPGDRVFWLTDLGWIMGPWLLTAGLANGAAVLLYDGAPDHPGPDRLWAFLAAPPRHPLRHQPHARAGPHGPRRRRPRPRHDLSRAADPRLHRRAVERGALALVLRARRRRPLPGHQHLRRHRGRRLLPVAPPRAADQPDVARRSQPRHGRRRVRRRRPPAARRGGRARVHASRGPG